MTPTTAMRLLVIAALLSLAGTTTNTLDIDPNGYIVYCPCMGRFGNQAEQFLGSLQFAKHLNRTLILPPFIEYVKYKIKFVPFDEYIDVEPLREYHRVILMEQFMSTLAPLIWKEADRSISCYASRDFGATKPPVEGCNPFEGSPFKEFWHHIGVRDFAAGSMFYAPIHTDYNFARDWVERYGNEKVLAFVGAPSSFPTNSRAVQLQKYVHLSGKIRAKSAEYREERRFARLPYLSLHIRHGLDWSRACDLIKATNGDLQQLFSSQQCLGDKAGQRAVTFDLCLPSSEQIIDSIMFALAGHSYRHPNELIKHIHIASDFDNLTLWRQVHRQLPDMTLLTPSATIQPDGTVRAHHAEPHFTVDLYLMSHANVFIGNCISSFSAFASRYRIFNLHFDESTHFFAFDQILKVTRYQHDEL